MVTVKQQDGTTVDLADKKEMEKAIILSNKKKFQQAFGTPFYNYPPATLYMNDINEVRHAVRRIPTTDAEETLGVWIAPNGDTTVQCEKLVEKSKIWAYHMRTGVIRKDEAWLAMQSTIWRTFCYPLNAVNLSKKQSEAIMSPVLHYALPAMGICRNFPRAVVFSSLKHAGIGIKHIHTLQEIARLKDILQHKSSDTMTGRLYQSSLEYLLLELGMGTELHKIDYIQYQILATNSLIKSTWEFLYTYSIQFCHIKKMKNTTDDRVLMTEICTYNPTQLEPEV